MQSSLRIPYRRVCLQARSLHTSLPASSHIGRSPVSFPSEVTILHDQTLITSPRILSEYENTTLKVTGPLGELSMPIKPFVNLNIVPAIETDSSSEGSVQVSVQNPDEKQQRSMWGTTRNLIRNMIVGVSDGYRVRLHLAGVGYRATIENNNRTLALKLGYSHPIALDLPEGVTCTLPQPNRLILHCIDLQKVTEFAAKIQRWRKPEPYNQKGIFINDETIKKKEGKKK